MERKNADFVVLNDISREDIGFESDENEVVILGRDGVRLSVAKQSKAAIAKAILDSVGSK